jgi:hypothetical protein
MGRNCRAAHACSMGTTPCCHALMRCTHAIFTGALAAKGDCTMYRMTSPKLPVSTWTACRMASCKGGAGVNVDQACFRSTFTIWAPTTGPMTTQPGARCCRNSRATMPCKAKMSISAAASLGSSHSHGAAATQPRNTRCTSSTWTFQCQCHLEPRNAASAKCRQLEKGQVPVMASMTNLRSKRHTTLLSCIRSLYSCSVHVAASLSSTMK